MNSDSAMLLPIKRAISSPVKSLLLGLGYQLIRKNLLEIAPWEDMQQFIPKESSITIFDIGANIGQTVDKALKHYPNSRIHSSEPSPSTYSELCKSCSDKPLVKTWNLGIGSSNTTLTLNENDFSFMSSFLVPGEVCAGKTKDKTEVKVVSVDSFCSSNGIQEIDILKIDTQGFELEVFKGAEKMMAENRIKLIFFELSMRGLHQDLPPYYQLLEFLEKRDFKLASFYAPRRHGGLVTWTEMLYISNHFYLSVM